MVDAISGFILVEGIHLLGTKLKMDDPVGAIAVHGLCGIWGTLAVGLFFNFFWLILWKWFNTTWHSKCWCYGSWLLDYGLFKHFFYGPLSK
ncbi:hypothetical protein [Clostridium sp. 1xD42-85]|uniref:hypothetical protein n=1 Tax=Clostridia TaxID=186801 RepID=UPI0018F59FAC